MVHPRKRSPSSLSARSRSSKTLHMYWLASRVVRLPLAHVEGCPRRLRRLLNSRRVSTAVNSAATTGWEMQDVILYKLGVEFAGGFLNVEQGIDKAHYLYYIVVIIIAVLEK